METNAEYKARMDAIAMRISAAVDGEDLKEVLVVFTRAINFALAQLPPKDRKDISRIMLNFFKAGLEE